MQGFNHAAAGEGDVLDFAVAFDGYVQPFGEGVGYGYAYAVQAA